MYKEENKILGSQVAPGDIKPWNVMPAKPPVNNVMPPVQTLPIQEMPKQVMPNPIMPIQETPNKMMPMAPLAQNSPMQTMPIRDMANQVVFPEIFYKMQPYIMMVCDQIEAFGNAMPTQEMIEGITDNIYEDMSKMYPDLVEYANEKAVETVVSPYDFRGDRDWDRDRDRDHDRRRRPFRRRGMFRDVIDILLLSELFGRRRRRY